MREYWIAIVFRSTEEGCLSNANGAMVERVGLLGMWYIVEVASPVHRFFTSPGAMPDSASRGMTAGIEKDCCPKPLLLEEFGDLYDITQNYQCVR